MKRGQVNIEHRKDTDTIRIRFTYQGQRKGWTIGKYSNDVLLAAIATADLINSDIAFRRFDETEVKYGNPKAAKQYAEVLVLPVEKAKEWDLKDCWEFYKECKINAPKIAKEKNWKPIDSWLNECPSECLDLDNANKFINWLLTKYSQGTIDTRLRTIKAAINYAIEQGQLNRKNPFIKLSQELRVPKKKEIKSFDLDEARIIIDAFRTGRFDSKHTSISSAHYADFVEFRFLTGCRPSEAIALTWKDIHFENNRTKIVISKRYSCGELLIGTKNKVDARIFNCNGQLTEFLKHLEPIPNEHNLLFPSPYRKYIDDHNFCRRWWKPIVTKLVELGEVKEYLPWYDVRHTFGTQSLRHGTDLQTLSSIMGNSPETLTKHYLAPNDDGNYLPEF